MTKRSPIRLSSKSLSFAIRSILKRSIEERVTEQPPRRYVHLLPKSTQNTADATTDATDAGNNSDLGEEADWGDTAQMTATHTLLQEPAASGRSESQRSHRSRSRASSGRRSLPQRSHRSRSRSRRGRSLQRSHRSCSRSGQSPLWEEQDFYEPIEPQYPPNVGWQKDARKTLSHMREASAATLTCGYWSFTFKR